MRGPLRVVGALAVATAVWLPCLHLFFRPSRVDVERPWESPLAAGLLGRQIALYGRPASRATEIERMRRTNPEWDFMARTYFAAALLGDALEDPDHRARRLALFDRIVAEMEQTEAERGMEHFLLPYARRRTWVETPARSLFVDGEIAFLLAARQLVAPRDDQRARLHARVEIIAARMQNAPILSAESYPDECWTFCNTLALAAVRISDLVLDADHGELIRAWVRMARARLVDRETGMLISSYRFDGTRLDGPEGSSIFMAAHDLRFVDDGFARDQYRRARRYLAKDVLGFAFAREWPGDGGADVDSGPIVPLVEASAGASGMAVLGAAAFDDPHLLRGLVASLNLVGFPVRRGGQVRFAASNAVGDAVVLYALFSRPLLDRFREIAGERAR